MSAGCLSEVRDDLLITLSAGQLDDPLGHGLYFVVEKQSEDLTTGGVLLTGLLVGEGHALHVDLVAADGEEPELSERL